MTTDSTIDAASADATADLASTDGAVIEPAAAVAAGDATAAVADAPTIRRSVRILAGVRWAAARLIAIGLFIGGLALGYNAFLAGQPPAATTVDPATNGVETPAVVREFIAALTSNDEAALRSAVAAGPYSQLVTEMERWQFQEVTSVETLSTFADGPRIATEIIMSGRMPTGAPTSINLIVHVDDGKITMFR